MNLLISQMLPALAPYFYDMAVVIFAIVYLKSQKLDRHLLIFITTFCLILLIQVLKYQTDWQIPNWAMADIRPFIVISLVVWMAEKNNEPVKTIIACMCVYIVVSLMLISLACLNTTVYIKLISFWSSTAYPIGSHSINFGRPISLNEVASLQGRYSTFFLQPVSSGLVNAILIFITVQLRREKLITLRWCVLTLTSLFIIGVQSASTAFMLFPLLFIIYHALEKKAYAIIIVTAIVTVTCLILLFNFDLKSMQDTMNELEVFVTSGRYSSESHIIRMITYLNPNFIDLTFGFNPIVMGWEGKGIGDSGFLLKILTGGIFYAIIYYVLMYKIYVGKYDQSIFAKRTKITIFIYLLLAETGTTAFSLPQVTVFLTIFTALMSNALIKKYRQSAGSSVDWKSEKIK